MIKHLTIELLTLFSFYLIACNGKDTNHSNFLIGAWVYSTNQDSIFVMQRVQGLDSSKFGFVINSDGTFLERSNSSWCATFISLKNYSGHWQMHGANEIIINVGYWGGRTIDTLQIVSVSNSAFKYLRK